MANYTWRIIGLQGCSDDVYVQCMCTFGNSKKQNKPIINYPKG